MRISTKAPIICIGIAVQDMVFGLETLPTSEGKFRASKFTSTGGGMAASAATAIARLGMPVELWTRLGNDAVGDAIVDELRLFGVDTTWCKRFSGLTSPVSAVLVDARGERLLVNYSDPMMAASVDWLPLDRVGASSGVLVDTRWEEGAAAVVDAAIQAKLPAVLDADSPPVPASLVQRATHCVFSERALQVFSGNNDTAQALLHVARMTNSMVAVTRGRDGVDWSYQGALHHQPAFPVSVVDTLGAGDVFHGAFALALAESQPLDAAMRFASAAAALKCAEFGGRRGAPRRSEVESMLNAEA